jgi:transposase
MNTTTFGLDIAKRTFQMYWVEAETGEIVNRRFSKQQLIEFLGQRSAGLVALEACGSAHWWARKIVALGHKVVLLHARFIRPFVQNNKTDATDARAIWTAAQQPGMRSVAPKSAEQQATLALHRMRSLMVKSRTMQVNQLRGLLYEFGVTLKGGALPGWPKSASGSRTLSRLFRARCSLLYVINFISSIVSKTRLRNWKGRSLPGSGRRRHVSESLRFQVLDH